MHRAVVELALVAALGGLGCGGKKPAPPAPAPLDAAVTVGPILHNLGPAPRVPFAEPHIAMPHQLRATLLEPGAAPRAVRRYRAVDETRELRIAMTISASGYHGGAWVGPTALPVITEGFGITTTSAATTIALRGLAGEIAAGAEAPAAEAAQYLARWRGLLERRRIAVATDPRGELGSITAHDDPSAGLGDDTRDELVQRWLGLAVPLPVEAIGVGARWRIVTLLRTGGAVMKQTATYRLAAIDGDTWTIDLELVRVAEQQLIDVPELPDDVSAELIALRRAVTGTLTVTATSPLPRAGRLTSTSSAHARFTAGAQGAVDEVSDDTATIAIDTP